MTSVIIVVKIDEEIAGSAPNRSRSSGIRMPPSAAASMLMTIAAAMTMPRSAFWNQAPATMPDERGDDDAVEQPDHHLAPDDAAGIVDIEVARRQRAHRHRHRLRAGIAAQRRHDRHQGGQRHHLLDRRAEHG